MEAILAFLTTKGFFAALFILACTIIAGIAQRNNLSWGGLISVDGKKISKGNLAFGAIFVIQVYYGVFEPTVIVAGLQEAFFMVLAYSLGTHFNNTANSRFEEKGKLEELKLKMTPKTTKTCPDGDVSLIKEL